MYAIINLKIRYLQKIFYIPFAFSIIYIFIEALNFLEEDIHVVLLHFVFALFVLLLARNIKRLGM